MLAGCGSATAPAPRTSAIETGLVLLSLHDGAQLGAATLGLDPVAITVSSDGRTAYVADSSPGDVYAVSVPALTVIWRQHVGGSPFGLLLHSGHLFVSLFAAKAVLELEPSSGARIASHPVPAGPAVLGVDGMHRVMVAGRQGSLTYLDGASRPAGWGFAFAISGNDVWTEDYDHSFLQRVPDGHRVNLPLRVHPFWVAPGRPGKLLVSAEGSDEDADPGAVFEFDVMSETFITLARPRDPDQVLRSGSQVLIAAHGDREVLAIEGTQTQVWARGAPAVALAAVPGMDATLVVVNGHE